MADEQTPQSPERPVGVPAKEINHPWPISILTSNWVVVKSARTAFVLFFSVGFILGCLATWRLYEVFVIPGKDATNESLKQALSNRPPQSNQQDSAVVPDNLSKMFILERVKNISGNSITLDYEPIPQTVKIRERGRLSNRPVLSDFKLEGRTLTFNSFNWPGNPDLTNATVAVFTNDADALTIEYVRKLSTKP
jgi:hypothetical protein